MSSMFILRDNPRGKKGETISVPFGVGRQMIAENVAIYLTEKEKLHAAALSQLGQVKETPRAPKRPAGWHEDAPEKTPEHDSKSGAGTPKEPDKDSKPAIISGK